MELGLALGLAGAAGIRTYFPLIIMGLLTRFSETMAYNQPFRIFAAAPIILLLAVLAYFEKFTAAVDNNQVVLAVALRALGGAILFAGTFTGFGVIGGVLVGAVVAILAYLITVRLKPEADKNNPGNTGLIVTLEDTLAIAGTLLAILLPWSSYLLWGVITFVFVKKLKDYNHRYRPDTKARSWR